VTDVLLTPQQAAAICDTSVQTLIRWRGQDKPPPFDILTKCYPASALGKWVREEMTLRRGAGGSYPYMPDVSRIQGTKQSDGKVVEKHVEETRLTKERADKIEMENAVSAGRLIPADDVEEAWAVILGRVRTRLLRIPSMLAPLVFGDDDVYSVQEKLERGVHDALEEASEDWQDIGDTDADSS